MLFQLPVTLRVTTAAAREGLQAAAEAAASRTSAASREALEEEDDVTVLGLWLARERAKVRCLQFMVGVMGLWGWACVAGSVWRKEEHDVTVLGLWLARELAKV